MEGTAPEEDPMGVMRCTCIGLLEPHVITGRPAWRETIADPECPCVSHRAGYIGPEPSGTAPA